MTWAVCHRVLTYWGSHSVRCSVYVLLREFTCYVGLAEFSLSSFKLLAGNFSANSRLIQCPFVLTFFSSVLLSDYVMKQLVLLTALLKHQFWILWNPYLLIEHQSLLLIDSQLQCSVIRYAFATSQETIVRFESILQTCIWISMQVVDVCLFHLVSSNFDDSCLFSDNCFGEWEGSRRRTTWFSSVKGGPIRRIVVSAEQQWRQWFCCS